MERPNRKDMILAMLEKEPDDVFLNYALAMEYIGVYNYTQAEYQLHKVLGINSNYLPCFYQLGQLKEKQAENEKAIDYYKQGIEIARDQQNAKALGELKEALWLLED